MRISAVEAEMCIIIAQWPVQNFWLRLNRENGTFCNHHVMQGKYKLAHISGTVRRTKMELSPNCCSQSGLSHESVIVYRTLWLSGTTCRNLKIWGPKRAQECINQSEATAVISNGVWVCYCKLLSPIYLGEGWQWWSIIAVSSGSIWRA